MAKIGKSIRVSQKVLNYIETYKGEGFNEKFENIITDAMESESKRKEKIKQLDKQIADKENQYRKIMADVSKLNEIPYLVNNIIKNTKELDKKLVEKAS